MESAQELFRGGRLTSGPRAPSTDSRNSARGHSPTRSHHCPQGAAPYGLDLKEGDGGPRVGSGSPSVPPYSMDYHLLAGRNAVSSPTPTPRGIVRCDHQDESSQ